MRNALEVITLEDLGIVRVRGVDAVRFLQGQLSNDIARLSPAHSILAGYHNPQGRTIALLRLMQWDADDLLAVVPRELAGVVASRLGKFVLRAKVKVADESAGWRVNGLVGGAPVALGRGASGPPLSELPSSLSAQTHGDGAVFVRVGDEPARWLVVSPVDAPAPTSGYVIGNRQTWLALDIAAGQPQVCAATSEEFVAQMLNLDVLNAIAFDKGCYTGQEVIARAHYRGRVKRRMQRFVSRDACHLAPGDSGLLADGRAFKVVLATQLTDGRCNFLAVAPLAGAAHDGAIATASGASGTAGTPSPTAAATILADQLSLPYSLPD
ncbi:MAG: YgfZ/GcvT domain-containing protein [Steroidobacteraceae bacterium]